VNRLTRYITGVGTAALLTVTAAGPAQAQFYPRDRDDGIGVGDILQGVAIAAAAAVAIGAIRGATQRGYDDRYRYPGGGTYGYPAGGTQYGYGSTTRSTCAQRYGGRVSVTDVDRPGSRSFRVRGEIDTGYNARYDRSYDRGYDRYDRYNERRSFTCKVREDGRISDFDTRRS